MAESSNVVPIKPRTARVRKPFKFPDPIRDLIQGHQDRVYEALAVARLLSDYITDNPEDLDGIAVRASDAIVRILEPVEGLGSELDLAQQLAEQVEKRGHE